MCHRSPRRGRPTAAPAAGGLNSGGAAKPRRGGREFLASLPWIGPALILIFGVVLFPAVVMFFNSTRDISISGLDKGSVGFDNYIEVFSFPYFWPIFGRTIVWVVVVVAATVAHLARPRPDPQQGVPRPPHRAARRDHPVGGVGRHDDDGRLLRARALLRHHQQVPRRHRPHRHARGLRLDRNPATAFAWSIVVAIFVSLPFTTYTILAGPRHGARRRARGRQDGRRRPGPHLLRASSSRSCAARSRWRCSSTSSTCSTRCRS